MLESQRLLGVKVTLICLVVREFLFPSSLRHRIENYCILFYFVLFYFILFYFILFYFIYVCIHSL